jgi:hypothetical protein
MTEVPMLLKGRIAGEVRRTERTEESRLYLMEFLLVHFQIVLQREVFMAELALVEGGSRRRRRWHLLVFSVLGALVAFQRRALTELLAAFRAQARLLARVNE